MAGANSLMSTGLAANLPYVDLDILTAIRASPDTDEDRQYLDLLGARVNSVRAEMDAFRAWCDRADGLYYSNDITAGGADLWPTHPNAGIPGRSHVSINTPAAYVDVPAALQAVSPIENMLSTDDTKEGRAAAAAVERIYRAWQYEEDYDLKFHKACTVKALYGRTAGRIYWKREEKRPCIEIVEQPRNLWMGYRNDSYDQVEWAAYVQQMDPIQVIQEFEVDIISKELPGENRQVPWVVPADPDAGSPGRSWMTYGNAMVHVWDFWFRRPVYRNGKFVRVETWNVVLAGNMIVSQPTKYPEYKGRIPYVPLFNTFLPGVPNGRPELFDMEQIIREKFERITSGSQMIASGTAGDYWQLVGPEAPSVVPTSLKPTRNKIVAPGAGNRIETITPFIAQFQLEQYLVRLDREATVISGLNELLLGLAPAQVLSSSKAINALVANYEARLSMRRALLYSWRRETWDLAVTVWAARDKTVREVVDAGGGRLDITDPSLLPRDAMETATRAGNLVSAKLWSQRRGMDAVDVDDPEAEQDMIREESTDATLWPERVQLMAQLLGALQALGLQPNQATQQIAGAQAASGQGALRQALAEQTPDNTTSSQLPGDQGITPPIPGAPEAAGGPPAQPFAQGAPAAGGQASQLQTMIQGGEVKGRILTQQQLRKA